MPGGVEDAVERLKGRVMTGHVLFLSKLPPLTI